jgi:nitroreductase
MGSVFEVIEKRRSVRRFGPKEVEDEDLAVILESARLAPSSSNSQTWHFVVVRQKQTINQLAAAVPFGPKSINSWIETAPLIIAACARPDPILHRMGQIADKDYHRIDVAIAVEHMVLTATDLGLDSCIVGWFSRKKARRILGLPLSMEVVLLLVLGYGLGDRVRPERKRKNLDDIVSFESYGTRGSV